MADPSPDCQGAVSGMAALGRRHCEAGSIFGQLVRCTMGLNRSAVRGRWFSRPGIDGDLKA